MVPCVFYAVVGLLALELNPAQSAPTGCSGTGLALCDFSAWSPPISNADFSGDIGAIDFTNVDGTFPSGALSGMTGSSSYSGSKQLTLDCGFGNFNSLTVLSDSFGSSLNWVEMISITDCYNMEFNDNAFSAMTSITTLAFSFGNFTSISSSAFSGLTSLTLLNLYVSFPASGVPSGLFSGLTALQTIDINAATLYSLPSGLFSDLLDLTTLNLLNTGLTTLPDGVFYPLLSLTTFGDTNSWDCTCDMTWYGEWLQDRGYTSTCATPSTLAGYDLSRAVKTLDCTVTTTTSTSSTDLWFYYGVIAGISATALLAIIAILLSCTLVSRLEVTTTNKRPAKPHAKTQVTNIKVEKTPTTPNTSKRTGRITPSDVSLTKDKKKENNGYDNLAF